MCEIKTVKVLASDKGKKATIVAIDETLFGITKHCMPKTEFESIFPNNKIEKWEHISRDQLISITEVQSHLNELSRTAINWNVRRLN